MTLSASRDFFYDWLDTPRPVDLHPEAKSDAPYIDREIRAIIKTAPPWAQATMRQTFVGIGGKYLYSESQENITSLTFTVGGLPPFIAIHPRLTQVVAVATWFYQALLDVATQLRSEFPASQTFDEEAFTNRMKEIGEQEDWRNLPLWGTLLLRVGDATAGQVADQDMAEAFALSETMPPEFGPRAEVLCRTIWHFVLSHEYGHCLLGHVPGVPDSTTASTAAALADITSESDEELECDGLGAIIGLFRPTGNGDQMLSLLTGMRVAGVLFLVYEVLGQQFHFSNYNDDRTHPAAENRYDHLLKLLKYRMESLCNWPAVADSLAFAGSHEAHILFQSSEIESHTRLGAGMVRIMRSSGLFVDRD